VSQGRHSIPQNRCDKTPAQGGLGRKKNVKISETGDPSPNPGRNDAVNRGECISRCAAVDHKTEVENL
jgi:hypothetical protein